MRATGLLAVVLIATAACKSGPRQTGPVPVLSYVGSSTVGHFMREASEAYAGATFTIETAPESDGGEEAIRDGNADLGGVARAPRQELLDSGASATLIGRDAIAVVVNAALPVRDLSLDQLARVFAGEVESWSELGGPDVPVEAFVMAPESATPRVFRAAVLGERDYAGCQVVRPDREMLAKVAGAPGGIGQISFSFLEEAQGLKTVTVGGEAAEVTNFDYPIARPLYLLWRPGLPAVSDFIAWTQSEEGQRVVMRRFVGTGVVGSVVAERGDGPTGVLVVYTPTFEYYDGGLFYYPHSPYELRTRYGDLIRRVPNHRGMNDEKPTSIRLEPGVYLVRAKSSEGGSVEFFATVEAGRKTELRVEEVVRQRQ